MNQIGGPTLADTLLRTGSMRSENEKLRKRVTELEECLRRTRTLVCQVAWTGGLGDVESGTALYENNGEITRLVPMRPQDREELQELLNKDLQPKAISLEVGKSYRTKHGKLVTITRVATEAARVKNGADFQSDHFTLYKKDGTVAMMGTDGDRWTIVKEETLRTD